MSGPAARAELWRVRAIRRTPQGFLIGYGSLELEIGAHGNLHRECLEFWFGGERVADWVTRGIEEAIQSELDNLTAHERIRLVRSFHIPHPWLQQP